jgi:hypothetical protein
MSHGPRGLTTGAALAVGTGTLFPADATFAVGTAGAMTFAAGGGTGTGAGAAATGVEAGGAGAGDEAGGGAAATAGPAGCGSLLTVAIVVMFAALVTAGAGMSCRLSEGSGVREAVYTVPGWTATVLTVTGLIGSVEPGAGASVADGAGA